MRKISFDQLSAWSAERGYRLDDWLPSLGAPLEQFDVSVPGEPQAIAELLDDVVNLEPESHAWLFWARDWTIWNERSQEIGLAHLNLLTAAASRSAGCEKGHVYTLNAEEWRGAVALLAIPVLYGWDAHLLFESGKVLVDISHEGRLRVMLQKGHMVDASRLKAWQVSV